MKSRVILTITITFRNPAEIAEVERLTAIIEKTGWRQSEIYLAGLQEMSTKKR